MVISNLGVLLAERNIKISKVSQDTGISRTTLTQLASHYNQGIQFETLNKLCTYLHVAPADILLYTPIDFTLTCTASLDGHECERGEDPFYGRYTLYITATENGNQHKVQFRGEYGDESIIIKNKEPQGESTYYTIGFATNAPEVEEAFMAAYLKLPPQFRAALQEYINDTINTAIYDNPAIRGGVEVAPAQDFYDFILGAKED